LITGGVLVIGSLILLLIIWNTLFKYVPPNQHLVITAKNGESLPQGFVLAKEGQQGVQEKVLGEGWHFVMPVAYSSELEENTVVEPGMVGIVTSQGGKPLPPDRYFAEEGEQGIQRAVLLPGVYRLNLHGYKVEKAPAVEIPAGFVGVQRRLLGVEGAGRFAEEDPAKGPPQKGILHTLLQPGLYYLNTKEYEVIKEEVGIFQTSFHSPTKDYPRDTSIEFTCKGGFKIKMDCTIEWEVLPQDMPALVADFGVRQKVEDIVIRQQAKAIGRDKGINYGVQDLLEGAKRKEYQDDFTAELRKRAKEKNVVIHSAFIRNIEIPDQYMKQIREKQIAIETNITNQAMEAAALSDNLVERAQRQVDQKMREVEAETKKIVAAIDIEVENLKTRTENEIDKMTAEFKAKIAMKDAERALAIGTAKNDVTKLKETAKNNLFQLKMDAFQNDADAFIRYSMAQQLSPDLRVRLFHSGQGTFWTNLEGKNLNLLLPAPASPSSPEKSVSPNKETTGKNGDKVVESGKKAD
jgi:hypothetical protein